MAGGRRAVRGLGARAAAALGSVLWLVTLLSVLQWPMLSGWPEAALDFPRAHGAATLGAPDPAASGVVAHAGLPAAPALVEKRTGMPVGPSKGVPEEAAVGRAEALLPADGTGTRAAETGTPQVPRAEALNLPPSRAPPGPA